MCFVKETDDDIPIEVSCSVTISERKRSNYLNVFYFIHHVVGRAGLLRDPEQGLLTQYFKTKKPSSELVVFSYLKHCGESRITFGDPIFGMALLKKKLLAVSK
jgi:hypothetical protein